MAKGEGDMPLILSCFRIDHRQSTFLAFSRSEGGEKEAGMVERHSSQPDLHVGAYSGFNTTVRE